MRKWLLLFILVSLTSVAQDTKFWTTRTKIEVITATSFRYWDAGYTCNQMSKPGFRERWMPTKSCGSLVGLMTAANVGQVGLQYWMYKKHHHRIQHLIPVLSVAGSGVSIGYTYTH